MLRMVNKLAVVLALALCVQSVAAVRTEQKNFVALNQKLQANWKWEVRMRREECGRKSAGQRLLYVLTPVSPVLYVCIFFRLLGYFRYLRRSGAGFL